MKFMKKYGKHAENDASGRYLFSILILRSEQLVW